MATQNDTTPKRPFRLMAVLLDIFIVGGIVLVLIWKEKPVEPASSSPAAQQPMHNSNASPTAGKP